MTGPLTILLSTKGLIRGAPNMNLVKHLTKSCLMFKNEPILIISEPKLVVQSIRSPSHPAPLIYLILATKKKSGYVIVRLCILSLLQFCYSCKGIKPEVNLDLWQPLIQIKSMFTKTNVKHSTK